MVRASHPSLLRLFSSAIALTLSLVVFSSAVQAGRAYWYCTMMHRSMLHACCTRADHSREQHRGEAHDVIAAECCVAHNVAALEASTPSSSRSDHEAARDVVLRPSTAPQLAAQPPAAPRNNIRNSTLRAGPLRVRVHARVMVFLI